jgi:hypothetical protein
MSIPEWTVLPDDEVPDWVAWTAYDMFANKYGFEFCPTVKEGAYEPCDTTERYIILEHGSFDGHCPDWEKSLKRFDSQILHAESK